MFQAGGVHSLYIANLRDSDFGNYSCLAQNSLGSFKLVNSLFNAGQDRMSKLFLKYQFSPYLRTVL